MPRIRTIKPEIWEDESLAALHPCARLLFIGLITQSDDEGRQRGHAALLKAKVFPYDDGIDTAQVQGWLDAMQRCGMIQQYGAAAKSDRYIQITNWTTHQRVSKPVPSKLPEPNGKHPIRDVLNPSDAGDSGSPTGALPEDYRTDQGSGIRDRSYVPNGTLSADTSDPPPPQKQGGSQDTTDVFTHWQQVAAPIQFPDPSRVRLTAGRRRLIQTRLRSGYTVTDLRQAIDGFTHDPFHRGDNDRSTPFLDLKTIFRSDEKVDEGIRLAQIAEGNQAASSGHMRAMELVRKAQGG